MPRVWPVKDSLKKPVQPWLLLLMAGCLLVGTLVSLSYFGHKLERQYDDINQLNGQPEWSSSKHYMGNNGQNIGSTKANQPAANQRRVRSPTTASMPKARPVAPSSPSPSPNNQAAPPPPNNQPPPEPEPLLICAFGICI